MKIANVFFAAFCVVVVSVLWFQPGVAISSEVVVSGRDVLENAGQDAGSPSGDVVESDTADDGRGLPEEVPVPVSPQVQALLDQEAGIAALISGKLDLSIEPATLFDLDLNDEPGILVEIERLKAVVQTGEVSAEDDLTPAADEPAPGDGDVATTETSIKQAVTAETASQESADSVEQDVGDAEPGKVGEAPDVPVPDPALLAARLELDRARLAFYSMPRVERQRLVAEHVERREHAIEASRRAELEEAQRKAEAAEAERRKAVEAASRARSEAEKLVSAEKIRLLAVTGAQAEFETRLAESQIELDNREEQALTFRRMVREALSLPPGSSSAADELYDELRAFLRASRDEMADALSDLSSDSEVPADTGGGVVDVPPGIDASELDEIRRTIMAGHLDLAARENAFRRIRASRLYEQVRALNADRLRLLERIGSDKKFHIKGFTRQGLEQAIAETRQVSLVLRYHLVATLQWVGHMTDPDSDKTGSIVSTSLTALKWLFLILAFWWWRRRSGVVFEKWIDRIRREDRAARLPEPGRLFRFVNFVSQARRPLEWLLLVWLLVWLLPAAVRGHLEIVMLRTVFTWVLAGAFVIGGIDAIAGAATFNRAIGIDTAEVRLRSLRLVGYSTVVLGLILTLSEQLVGKGTVYTWVARFCWFAVVPLILVIIRWWREVIFVRFEATRKKGAFDRWVVSHRHGLISFPAAVFGGVVLFLRGVIRAVRSWITGFDLTRRALAWIFRRGMDRMAGDAPARIPLNRLDADRYREMGPDRLSGFHVPGSADEKLQEVVKRVARDGGGVYAVVGERGRGKSSMLSLLGESNPGVVFVECPLSGLDDLRRAIALRLGLEPEASLEACAVELNSRTENPVMVIDHVNRLVLPVMGGLAEFDRLMAVARHNSGRCAWIMSFNEVIWRFFERVRGSRPLFDDVIRVGAWREEEIVSLIQQRSAQAGVFPLFDNVMEKLPVDADEIDRRDALRRVSAGYYRMIWDYSDGNPGVALHVWRQLLGQDESGKVFVMPFQVPDAREIDRLPDDSVFVFRAVIQLEPALESDIIRATMLSADKVRDTLRFGAGRGIFELDDGRWRVSWNWYRPVVRLLQRRHLLAQTQGRVLS